MRSKIWLHERRPQFMLLEPCVVSVSIASAVYDGFLNPLHMVLSPKGIVFCHISENVINHYLDYRSDTDLRIPKTLFSGGSTIPSSTLLLC